MAAIPGWRLWVALSVILGTPAIAARADPCADPRHRFESFSLFAPALERSKRLLVYLPPGYDCAAARRYPAFYFNDGHDLFEWNPSAAGLDAAVAAEISVREAWYGSWRLDTQLDRAIADRLLPPLIVVGIASDDGMRSRDLAPVPWDGSADGRGPHYAEFVAGTVVPAVDARFRTAAVRRCRGIAGASLGGISALQIGLARPERFGMVLAFSPVLSDPALADYLAAAWPRAAPAGRSWFLVDFDDDPVGSADLARFAAARAPGRAPGRLTIVEQSPASRHSMASWAERVVPALGRLLRHACAD